MRRVLLLIPLALIGCSSGSDLELEDPGGFAACTALQESLEAENPRIKLDSLLQAGRLARDAETRVIFEAVESFDAPELAEFALPDTDALVAGCNEHGFDLEAPDVTPSPT